MQPIRIPVVSGGFDPIHSGHIELLRDAFNECGHPVIVLLNSDEWLVRKKGKAFMPFAERKAILKTNIYVKDVYAFDDADNTAVAGLKMLRDLYPQNLLVFCNGGDRSAENIPEMICAGFIEFRFGIGGENKKNSSSWILRDAIAKHKEHRLWGFYVDLYQTEGCKVKELVISSRKSISYQRHFHRSEVWYVRKGEGTVWVNTDTDNPQAYTKKTIRKDDLHIVPAGCWHKLENNTDEELVIIEIQYGTQTTENDIERILDTGENYERAKPLS